MLFETTAQQIQNLSPTQLIALMSRLIHAEAIRVGIPLYNAHIPEQITIPDGGEDGRIQCVLNAASVTAYFPSNFIAFQAKATNLTPAQAQKEIWKKRTGTEKTPPKLNNAIATVLKKNGSYILFTSKPLVGQTLDKYKQKLAEAITEAGGDPSCLQALEILDANKISAWANTHQGVALWLNEILKGKDYAGFSSYEHWGRLPEVYSSEWVGEETPRFTLQGGNLSGSDTEEVAEKTSFAHAHELLVSHLSEPQNIIRIAGASGIGKTRFAHQLFLGASTVNKICSANIIYCRYCDVKEKALQLASALSGQPFDSILVVDECDDESHGNLVKHISSQDSRVRLITINSNNSVSHSSRTILVNADKLENKDIGTLVKQLGTSTLEAFAVNFTGGSPAMAILVATAMKDGGNPIASVGELAERMIGGRNIEPTARRAFETLCLFGHLGCDGDKFKDIQAISARLAEVTPESMYRHLADFIQRGVVERLGDYYKAKPLPLSLYFAEKSLELMPPTTRQFLCDGLPDELQGRFVKQLAWLNHSDSAKVITTQFLSDEHFGNYVAITQGRGGNFFYHLAGVMPEMAMASLSRIFDPLSHEDLKAFVHGRQHIVWALEKLCFPRATFFPAARLLLRLAAAETETVYSNNATGYFKQLFHLQLSGTEAEPSMRLAVLDEGLSSSCGASQRVCIDALGEMLESHFTRSCGAEQFGCNPPLEDWKPKIYGDIFDFYREGIRRLAKIALSQNEVCSSMAKDIFASRLRHLLKYPQIFDELSASITSITQQSRTWPEAIYAIHDWLYFDSRKGSSVEYTAKVREFAVSLMPDNLIDLAVFYSKKHPISIHNPDAVYSQAASVKDVHYADRMAQELAARVSDDMGMSVEAAKRLISPDVKSPFAFMETLGKQCAHPESLFTEILTCIDSDNIDFNPRALMAFLVGVSKNTSDSAELCMSKALESPLLKKHVVEMLMARELTDNSLELIIKSLRSGVITPFDCWQLSCGRRLEHFKEDAIVRLVSQLEQHGIDGLEVSIQILIMYLHSSKIKTSMLSDHIKKLLLAKDLIGECKSTKSYEIETLFSHIVSAGYCDEVFAKNILSSLLYIDNSKIVIHDPLRSAKYKIVQILIERYPQLVWEEIATAYANPKNRSWLKLSFAPDDGLSGATLSALSLLPEDLYVSWAKQADSEARFDFILSWVPHVIEQDGKLQWHPSLQRIVENQEITAASLQSLQFRLGPSGWVGSRVPYLQQYLPLLKEWLAHSNPVVASWARDEQVILRKKIAQWRKIDEEDQL